MPTKRRRHTLTETDDIARALAISRSLDHAGAADSALLRELVVLGAETKALRAEQAVIDSRRRDQLRRRHLDRLSDGVDSTALEEVRRAGWSRSAG